MPVVRTDRRLVTQETIRDIRPIDGADAIEQAKVRGWTVVVRKGEFAEGDPVVYFEVDTALPLDDERFAFLAPRGTKEDDGALFHVLKTVKLRGTFSQGLVLPLEQFPDWKDLDLGKWESPIPTGNGEQVGPFLTQYARKTDSERVQNLHDIWDVITQHEWEATEKMEGTSCTIAREDENTLHVMGRNWEIRAGDNLYWNMLNRYTELGESLAPGEAVQLEIVGPGIQKNTLGLTDIRPVVFAYVREGKPQPRQEWPDRLVELATPILDISLPATPEEALEQAEGLKTLVGKKDRQTEGIVWHTTSGETLPELDHRSTWKAINNRYLLKHG